jgi:hypothetical protein
MKTPKLLTVKMAISGLVLLLGISSCKYKDGPFLSFHSAEARIIGTYSAEAFSIDGQDAMQLWKDSICDLYFSIGHATDPTNRWISSPVQNAYLSGNYMLIDHNQYFFMYSLEENPAYPGYGPFHGNVESKWEILKLRDKEIRMRTEFEGHVYEVKLQEIEW